MSAETDTGPLAGWAIVQSNGLTLIGRLVDGHDPVRGVSGQVLGTMAREGGALSPVYELKPAMSERGIGHLVVPMWLVGVDSISIPSGAIVHPCEELSRSQRVHLHRAVQQGEQMSAAMRAQESGVVLAPESALRGLGKP